MSDWYGARDAACPLSTRGRGAAQRAEIREEGGERVARAHWARLLRTPGAHPTFSPGALHEGVLVLDD